MEEIKLTGNEPSFSSVIRPEDERKTVEITVTAEEQELIFKGIRPDSMRYDVFDKVRKDLAKATKLYKGGKYKHISTVSPHMMGFKDMPEAQGTYVRTEPRRHETLNRRSHNVIV